MVLGTAGAGRALDMIDTAKSCSDSDLYNAGAAEAGSRRQIGLDGPGEITWHQSQDLEAVLVTGRLAATARASGQGNTCAGRAGSDGSKGQLTGVKLGL